MPRRASLTSEGFRDPNLFVAEHYQIDKVCRDEQLREYHQFLDEHYEALGFGSKNFHLQKDSLPFMIRYRGELAAIFRLTEIQDTNSLYYRLVPGAIRSDGRPCRLLEVNNVVIARRFRASAVLGLLLYTSAKESHSLGYDFVVGMNRFQILRHFVDFGVVPAEHPPEHILGKEHIQDFVNYYDTADPASIAYMHERAKRYFWQEYVMCRLRQNHVEKRQNRTPSPMNSSASPDPSLTHEQRDRSTERRRA